MAGFTIDSVTLDVLNTMSQRLSVWQNLLKDGRRIKNISVTMSIDSKEQPSYDITVDYYDAPSVTMSTSS